MFWLVLNYVVASLYINMKKHKNVAYIDFVNVNIALYSHD